MLQVVVDRYDKLSFKMDETLNASIRDICTVSCEIARVLHDKNPINAVNHDALRENNQTRFNFVGVSRVHLITSETVLRSFLITRRTALSIL